MRSILNKDVTEKSIFKRVIVLRFTGSILCLVQYLGFL